MRARHRLASSLGGVDTTWPDQQLQGKTEMRFSPLSSSLAPRALDSPEPIFRTTMASTDLPVATGADDDAAAAAAAAAARAAAAAAAAAEAAAAAAAATVGVAAAAAMLSVLLSGPGNVQLPVLGFGTGTAWFKQNNGELERALGNALTAGFRSLDSSEMYENEDAERVAVAKWLQTTGAAVGVTRKDLVITSKVLFSIDREVRAHHPQRRVIAKRD